MWARCCSGCSPWCSRIRSATPKSTSCPVSSALVYALVAALGNVVGALAVTRRAARGLAVIEHFVAFGAGFMLAVAVVELLPEAFARSGAAAPGLVLAGYLAVHLTQHTLTPHFHFGEETHAVNRLAGTTALVGLLLHTFFDGVAIASAFLVRPALGAAVFGTRRRSRRGHACDPAAAAVVRSGSNCHGRIDPWPLQRGAMPSAQRRRPSRTDGQPPSLGKSCRA